MAQPSVSVVIPVWNQWQFTKACLETLRPTLGVRDEVIVVDNGSEDQTPTGLKTMPGIKIITNEVNQGFAIACNQGAAAAKGDIIVFLNNDTLLVSHWLDGLITPFADPAVAATGPRSNMVSGPQLVESVDYQFGSTSQLRRFAKKWQQEHRGETTETNRLVGFALAVRRSAFEAINGFDEGFETGGCEDDDLCIRLIDNGGRLLITHDSFVHHHGHATFDGNGLDWFAIQQDNMDRFRVKHGGAPAPRRESGAPLLSACMIIKNEEALLSDCLSSLNGLVDEVVIYDTGSTDNSIQLARDSGATVIEGYWDDDFGRARNAALDACKGEWVLHIDADEVFEGNPMRFREQLAGARTGALQMEILNLSGDGRNDLTHRPCRVFRRAQYHWSGRLHEQVVLRSGLDRTEVDIAENCRLIHSGYTPEQMELKNKAERNIRIAQADADVQDDRDAMDKVTNLARSYTLAGRHEDALALYTQARSMKIESEVALRTLLRAGAQACLTVGRPEDALEWAAEFGDASRSKDGSRYLTGMALADLHRWDEALAAFDGLDKMTDDDGVVFPQTTVHIRRAQCLAAVERWHEAAGEINQVAGSDEITEPIWALAAEAYFHSGRDVSELLNAVPNGRIVEVLGQLRTATPAAADVVLDALFAKPEFQTSVLALAIRVAPALKCERAIEWSMRLRQVGLTQDCPLIAKAWDGNQSGAERVRAATLAHTAFRDERAMSALKYAAPSVDPAAFDGTLYEISELAPEFLEAFVVAAASLPDRSLAMARSLHGLGAEDEGVAVLVHGFEKEGVDPTVAGEAAAWLESVGRSAEAASLRRN